MRKPDTTLARSSKANGDIAGAIEEFQKAIELKPDFEDAHYNLGIALRAQGKAEAGKKELEELTRCTNFGRICGIEEADPRRSGSVQAAKVG